MGIRCKDNLQENASEADIIEQEANEFAMCLLMPEDWIRRDIKALGGIDIEGDLNIHKLAKKYKVSTQLMTLRIAQLFPLPNRKNWAYKKGKAPELVVAPRA